jgi:lactate dehydrogenase-like 2-hydroxyacid dehydrogenase
MPAPQILQVGPLAPQTNATLQQQYGAAALWQQADPIAWARSEGQQVRVVVTSARHGCSVALIDALPRLEAIVSFGVGYDAIALDAARARGIQVSNTPDVLNDCVADLAFGLLLDAARGIAHGDRFVRAGRWPQGGFPLTTRVSGKKLGILGLGRIGEIVARRAQGFDMEIAYNNRRLREGAPWRFEPDSEGAGDVGRLPGGGHRRRAVDGRAGVARGHRRPRAQGHPGQCVARQRDRRGGNGRGAG